MILFSLQGHPGLDGAKGETGAAGAKVWENRVQKWSFLLIIYLSTLLLIHLP